MMYLYNNRINCRNHHQNFEKHFERLQVHTLLNLLCVSMCLIITYAPVLGIEAFGAISPPRRRRYVYIAIFIVAQRTSKSSMVYVYLHLPKQREGAPAPHAITFVVVFCARVFKQTETRPT